MKTEFAGKNRYTGTIFNNKISTSARIGAEVKYLIFNKAMIQLHHLKLSVSNLSKIEDCFAITKSGEWEVFSLRDQRS
jgi:hypothetical protein